MVQIDDSGSGSLVGGTCIGAVRSDTMEYAYDFIPIGYYREGIFKTKEYLTITNDIVFSLLNRLNYKKSEAIQICQGYMFDITRANFKKKGISYSNVKIEEPLQSLIESTFQEYTLSLGVPPQYVKYTKYPLHFHRILRWVYSDYAKRASLCKTGWKSWNRYGDLSISKSEDILYASNYVCLRCGFGIAKKSQVEKIEYNSNCINTIYLHKNC